MNNSKNEIYNIDGIKTQLENLQENKISMILNFPNNPYWLYTFKKRIFRT